MAREERHCRQDELLELLWHLDEKHDLTIEALREHDPEGDYEEALSDFSTHGILGVEGSEIVLTERGREEAASIVRRHRLAERLMVDVLGQETDETEKAACEFEHVLAPELVESICVLLGHPRSCPHGAPIPEGDCCVDARKTVESLITTVSEMRPGQVAKVASINTASESRFHKLLSLGITPGAMIKLSQTAPALVLEIDRTLVAIDEVIGKDIHVWRKSVT